MSEIADFDAIVVGSGMSGGWAAKELCEAGLKVLVLERGSMVRHGQDYVTEHMPPWEIPFGGKKPRELYARDYPVQSKVFAFNETTRHFFNNDRLNPYAYDEEKPFEWRRADVVGGRSLLWSRQVYRFSDLDFEANKRDGHGIDWPIRYADLAPWYTHVESFVGVSGEKRGLPHLPDGEFQKPMPLNKVERAVRSTIEREYPGRHMMIGRCAVQTEAKNGRGACHYCGPCERGCSVAAVFSSVGVTLPAAERTGNMTLRADSVVEGLDYDSKTGKVSAVRVIDANNFERKRYTAKLIFMCASTVATTQILLNSKSAAFPSGLANRSGVMGHYLMDHATGAGAVVMMPGYEDSYTVGHRPSGIYIPRFRNLQREGGSEPGVDFLRGYGYQGKAMRLDWQNTYKQIRGFGKDLKHALRRPGPWMMFMGAFAEHLPDKRNRMLLDASKPDRFGIPQVRFDASFGDNERRLQIDAANQASKMLKSAGAVSVNSFDVEATPGQAIHEMGTARMGINPQESVQDQWNRANDVSNLFVTDGACMTSSSCVNPSLTYMALTARAANYAAERLKAGAI